ncbi:hypothetical protein [Clostridium sp. D46t1_190503_E9]
MEMKFEILPSYSIAYIRQVGPYGEDNMQVMEEIKTLLEMKIYLMTRP